MPMVNDRMKAVRLVLLDVDGVLTSGEVTYTDQGDQIKVFNVRDGLGLRLLMEAGLQVGIVTGRKAQALVHRCRNLGIDLIFDGVRDKAKALDQIAGQTGLPTSQMAFVGDDLPDLPIMKRVGLAVAVKDAHPLVAQAAHWSTQAGGGKGAVRECCEAILKAQGRWKTLIQRLFDA